MIKGILLTILIILLVLILLLLIADFTVRISIKNGVTTVSAGAWPILLQIFPAKEKPEKKAKKTASKKSKRKKKQTAAANVEEKTKKSPEDIKALIGTVLELVKALLPPAGYVLGGIRFRHLILHISVSEENAAQTAIRYGQLNAALYGALPIAQQAFHIKADHIGVTYDFLSGKTQVLFSVEAHLRGGRIMWGALKMIGRAIPALWKMVMKKNKSPA